jgi:hypothetical protein
MIRRTRNGEFASIAFVLPNVTAWMSRNAIS